MPILLPTSYLPPISYMAACLTADEILIERWETYPKQTIRNRCEILGPNGRQRLSIPVSRPFGNGTKTKDIRIAHHLPWQQIHWRSLETAYNKSPYFLYYQDYFRPFYEKEFTFLLEFNMELLEAISQAIRLDRPVGLTESYRKAPVAAEDMREKFRMHDPGSRIPDLPEYYQVFSYKHGFQRDLSVVDLLFNTGPEIHQHFYSNP